ncbi:multicopper oxidase domain-containing protein [Brachybacterium sp. EF45031]|nr:cupredoxin domain-containing protein [Brachybacterium sillae]MCS6711334.1 multicopper oxidase domain-containing protein [Brachybacterium sillae]
MLALIVLVCVHPFVPQSRWLLVHMVTLGLLTTSIMVWGQHFAEALLKTRLGPETRDRQVLRIRILTVSIVLTCIGIVGSWPFVVVVGAVGVSAMILWFALSLISQLRSALAPRYAFTIRAYVMAACLLPLGAFLGTVLAFSPGEPWQGRLLLAHQLLNVLGFVGITVSGTLLTLWPTVLRTSLTGPRVVRASHALPVMLGAVLGAVAGALFGIPALGIAAVGVYLGALLWLGLPLAGAARHSWSQQHPAPLPVFPILSIGAGLVWFAASVAGLLALWAGSDGPVAESLLAEDVKRLTVPLVVGFALQVLLGAMSHLMPTVMGGGPRAVKASLAVMSRAAAFRVAVLNLVLLVVVAWAGLGSLSRVLLSLAAFAVLVWFVVLTVLMVRTNLRVRRETTPEPAPSTPAMDRRHLTGTLLGVSSVVGLAAVGAALDRAPGPPRENAAGAVPPTGETTTLQVSMADMRFTPDTLEVPAGNDLVIELVNDDPSQVHDLVLASGATSGRLAPGQSTRLEAGVISAPVEGWCSIVGHRSMGMTLTIAPIGVGPQVHSSPATGSTDPLAPVALDLNAAPGADHVRRDPTIPEDPGTSQRLALEISEHEREIAPGVMLQAMTFGGQVVGPVLRSRLGGRLTVDLVNNGSMGHSLDMHAGRVAPDEVMRTIPPGESLEYSITTDYAGIWLYHCSTMPMSVHLAAGMVGALIVPPEGLAAVDQEWVLVQSDHYLEPTADPAHAVSPAKIAAERPDATVFNGHANQYVHEPLQAKVGERVRIWVLAAGPSRGISFHVVGGIFDTVFKEGDYLLHPDTPTGGGSQALHLGPAQGGFVELVFAEPGTYTAVNHNFADMERGARALITVSE